MIYIAYGSNMSKARMLERCPGARFLTKGIVEHYTLQFCHYADAVPAHDYELPVVLWDIPEDEVAALEKKEGYLASPMHYDKQEMLVYPVPKLSFDEMAALVGAENVREAGFYAREGIVGTAFVMTDWKRNEWEDHAKPVDIDYLRHIITGYIENRFEVCRWAFYDLCYALARGEGKPESRS
jgi:hypothetical protein